MMKNLIYYLFASALILSCQKVEKLQDNQYFIFGIFNGYCLENCSTLFKIEDEKLFADDVDLYYPGQELRFEDIPLSGSKYDLALAAYDGLPSEMIDNSEMSFGCPGCLDQNIILLIHFDGIEEKMWLVDTDIEMIPDYLRDYAQDIISLVGRLEK